MKNILFLWSLLVITFIGVSQEKILFEDKFDNNEKRWLTNNHSGILAKVANGKYIIERTASQGADLFMTGNGKFSPSQDFEIITRLKQLSGNQKYGYGLVWGAKDGANFFAFTITSDGKCSIYRFEEGEYIQISPWMRLGNDIINPLGEINKLRIKKTENRVAFFVNDELIHTTNYQPFMGQNIGYVLNMNQKVVVGDIVVKRPMNSAEKAAKPEVVWFTPSHELTTVYTKTVHIEAGIKSIYPLRGARLLVNDEVHGGVIGGKNSAINNSVKKFREIVAEELVLKPGINEIELIVEDLEGHRTFSKRIIKVDSKTETTDRRDYALLFATNEYDNWSNLTNPVFDAKAISKELSERYGFEVELVQNANKSQMMSKLKQYARKAYNPHDQLFVFFAGHGQYDEDFGEGYVVCSNSLQDDDGNTSYLPHSILRTVINNISCEHTFLMMDVCFGGTFDQQLAKHRGGGNNLYQDVSQQQYVSRKLQFKTRKFITSGGKEYVPDGIPGNHSPFARKVLEALRNNGGSDMILTFTELLNYVERAQPNPHFGEFGDNEPGSDFLFILKQ
jgi:hypothetical protein